MKNMTNTQFFQVESGPQEIRPTSQAITEPEV